MLIGFEIDENNVVICWYFDLSNLEIDNIVTVEVSDDFVENLGDKQFKYENEKLIASADLLQIHNNKARIAELKQLLADTDYISNKIIEFTALQQINGTNELIPENWVEIMNERENYRIEINQLETELNELGE